MAFKIFDFRFRIGEGRELIDLLMHFTIKTDEGRDLYNRKKEKQDSCPKRKMRLSVQHSPSS